MTVVTGWSIIGHRNPTMLLPAVFGSIFFVSTAWFGRSSHEIAAVGGLSAVLLALIVCGLVWHDRRLNAGGRRDRLGSFSCLAQVSATDLSSSRRGHSGEFVTGRLHVTRETIAFEPTVSDDKDSAELPLSEGSYIAILRTVALYGFYSVLVESAGLVLHAEVLNGRGLKKALGSSG
jgi:hypothetical protein